MAFTDTTIAGGTASIAEPPGSYTWAASKPPGTLEDMRRRRALVFTADHTRAGGSRHDPEPGVGQSTTDGAWSEYEALEAVALVGKPELFAQYVEGMSWGGQPASLYVAAVRWAVGFGLVPLARRLASEGAEAHPYCEVLLSAAAVLARPSARRVHGQAGHSLAASADWIRKHGDELRGSWVAVRSGRLVASADSYRELVDALESEPKDGALLIARV